MQNFESTYALLVRSEEKKRNVLEIVVYTLFILSAAFSIWQFAHQSIAFPLDRVTNASAGVIEARPS